MSLNHVILGFLHQAPKTGYELKKVIQATPYLHWSGNNNQIYKAFAELLDEGFVTKVTEHQIGLPSKNVYSITQSGSDKFKKWLLSLTEVPTFRKEFLVKLALANFLPRTELERMVASYKNTLKMQAILSEKEFAQSITSKESSYDSLIMPLIRENILSFYDGEYTWLEKVSTIIDSLPVEEKRPAGKNNQNEPSNARGSNMKYQIVENNNGKYLHCAGSTPLIQSESDALNIISACAEHDTNAVLLDGDILSDDFVRLRTGIAGTVLQKFMTYNIKACVVIKSEQIFPERFKEMISEYKNGNKFRIFTNLNEAEKWLQI